MTWDTPNPCRYCFDPVTNTGPCDRGTERVALLRVDGNVFVFCSPECRTAWVDSVGGNAYDTRDMAVADDVDADTLR